MSAITIAAVTCVCTFGSAWLAMLIRSALPQSHMSKESQDVVRLGMGLVATMTALLLGLVTATAKGSFDSHDSALRSSAVNILALDRHLARYGPETQPIRNLLRVALAARIDAMWPAKGVTPPPSPPGGGSAAEEIQSQILALAPANDAQRWFKAEALGLTEEVVKTRWRMLGSGSGSVPKAFLAVVIFWLTMTFASFGLFAPKNGTVLAVFLIASLSVAAAVYLILELDAPYEGVIKISSGPLRYALDHIGK